ncbi:MAG: TrkH family potassium uptake protein [Candidatus Omnitrophota bacterium]
MAFKREVFDKFLDAIIKIAASVSFILLVFQWGVHVNEMPLELFNRVDTIVLYTFLTTVALRFLLSPSKLQHFKKNWLDLIVIIPAVQFFAHGLRTACLFIVIRQSFLLFKRLFRSGMLQKLINLLGLKPAQLLVVSFGMTILVGAFLLTLPIATQDGSGADFIDALFTATSATCVTGLIVQDTGTFFSTFGQIVILALIQVGALGIMTFSVTLFLAVGRQVSSKERMAMQEVLDQDSAADILGLVKFIVGMTISVELIGAAFLYFSFTPYISDPLNRLYAAVFHSISAFCNAGFSVFSDNLMAYVTDPKINLCICFLIIFGGIGFIVVKDLWDKYIIRKRSRALRLKLHTKLVLTMSLALLIIGTVCIYFAESNAALKGMPLKDQILVSFFQSTSARTAGFNTIDIGKMTNSSVFIMIVLMFIGASAGSTGGGIKTTTFWIILKAFTSHMKNKEDISAFKRKIPDVILGKAITVVVLSTGLVILFTYLLGVFEQLPFRDLVFEVVSAFGTVGLSCGITFDLNLAGKVLITILMFLGRLGPLTVVLAFSRYTRKINYTYAEEKIMVG